MVSDLESGRVIWLAPGHSGEALAEFFAWLGERRSERIEAAAIDLSHSYEETIRRHCPGVAIVYDRYHVAKLLLEALNDVRKQVVKAAAAEERPLLTNKKWLLLRHERGLDQDGAQELEELLALNEPLQTAHLLKEEFLHLYEIRDEDEAGAFLVGWVKRAMASELEPFRRFGQRSPTDSTDSSDTSATGCRWGWSRRSTVASRG